MQDRRKKKFKKYCAIRTNKQKLTDVYSLMLKNMTKLLKVGDNSIIAVLLISSWKTAKTLKHNSLKERHKKINKTDLLEITIN